MRTIIWFFYFWAILFKWIPSFYRVKQLYKEGRIQERDALVDRKVKEWSKSLVKLSGTKIIVSGEEHIPEDSAVLFVSNHQGNFDIPILLGYINKPKAFISKIEVKRMPFIGTWMEQLNCLFMDRNNVRQSVKAINEGAELLRNGTSLVIFPEGTRSKGDEMASFKTGSFKLATKSGVPVIPVTISGSYKIMEQQGFWIKPAVVYVEVHPPIYPQNQEARELAQQTEHIIKKGVQQAVS